MEAAHSALDASIYRLSNVRLHFNNCVVDPQNFGPNWSLCRDIESSVVTEFLVFVAGFCHSMQFFVAACSLGLFLDSIATNFDNVATEFLLQPSCSCRNRNVLCRDTKFVALSSFYTPAFGNCRDIIFFIATNFFLFSISTLSR